MREHEDVDADDIKYSYVLIDHEHAEESFAHLIDDFIDGVGVRAVAHASGRGDFTHVIALHAKTDEHMSRLSAAMPSSSGSGPTVLGVCVSPDCIAGIVPKPSGRPSWMPPWEFMIFVLLELGVSIHEEKFILPELASKGWAAAVGEGGKLLLIELGGDHRASLDEDLQRLTDHSSVEGVRSMRTSGERIVRAVP